MTRFDQVVLILDAAVGERRDRDTDHGVEHGQHRDRERHLPQDVEVASKVRERVVAHEHVADEEHDLGKEGEREDVSVWRRK